MVPLRSIRTPRIFAAILNLELPAGFQSLIHSRYNSSTHFYSKFHTDTSESGMKFPTFETRLYPNFLQFYRAELVGLKTEGTCIFLWMFCRFTEVNLGLKIKKNERHVVSILKLGVLIFQFLNTY